MDKCVCDRTVLADEHKHLTHGALGQKDSVMGLWYKTNSVYIESGSF